MESIPLSVWKIRSRLVIKKFTCGHLPKRERMRLARIRERIARVQWREWMPGRQRIRRIERVLDQQERTIRKIVAKYGVSV